MVLKWAASAAFCMLGLMCAHRAAVDVAPASAEALSVHSITAATAVAGPVMESVLQAVRPIFKDPKRPVVHGSRRARNTRVEFLFRPGNGTGETLRLPRSERVALNGRISPSLLESSQYSGRAPPLAIA